MNMLALLMVLSIPTKLDEPPPIDWLTGKTLDRSKELAISVRWRDVPLRDRLIELSHRQGIPVLFDRRIDPGQALNLDINQKTWEQVLWDIAQELDLEICQFDELYYFAPPGSAVPLRATYDQNREQLRRNRKRLAVPWLKVGEFEIPPLVQPRQLLEKLARQHDLTVSGLDRIPLDVWPGYRLPKIDLLQQFTLLLSGFELYPSISDDGKTVTIEEIPLLETAQLRIPCRDQPKAAAEALAPRFKQLSIRPYSQGLTAQGPVTELVKLQASLVARQKAIVGQETRKDFTVTASRGQILATMAHQLKVKMVLEAGTRSLLETQVTLRMSGASEQDVIQKVLEGTGLTFELTGDQLKIIRQQR